MATSGRLLTSAVPNAPYGRFYVDWSVTSQDIATNRTFGVWAAGVTKPSGFYGSNAVRLLSGSAGGTTIPSGTFNGTSGGGDQQLRSGSFTVNHNPDGTATISVSISGELYHDSGFQPVSRSQSWELPTIPRFGERWVGPGVDDWVPITTAERFVGPNENDWVPLTIAERWTGTEWKQGL